MGLEEIKPYKSHTHESGEFGVVDQIVSPAVKHILQLMHDSPGSTIEKKRILGFARLLIPGQPPMRIKQENVLSVIEWCICFNSNYEFHIDEYHLHPRAIDYIKGRS